MPRTHHAVLGASAALLVFSTALGAQGAAPQQGPAEWLRGATCYEIFVRSFSDSDGDGVGDFNGLTAKLDYINDGNPATMGDLGARCIWLMPIAPSPSYHGYDVTDYYRINPDYGTRADFDRFIAEAHRRGIRVLVDMVLNHSSNEHPFFKAAALHPGSAYRDWYIWLPQHPGVKNPWGGDNWHKSPVREEFYYGFFWSGMPDLNVENPAVVAEAKKVATHWLQEMKVDGFRLDAIRHLVEADNGRQVANLPGTHAFLRDYAAHVRSVKADAFTIGEVWDSTGAMLPYYPDQLDAHFAFEVADSIVKAVKTETARGLLPPVMRLQRELPAWRWSPFLRNHDQTRSLTEFGGDIGKAKVAATLLLTLPGLPFVYYGEELGMTGDKPDPRLRTPMHWARGDAAGFTTGVPWEPLQPDSLTANVEAQDGDPQSLLNLHRKLIHLRAANPALAGGRLLPLTTSSLAVAAFVRREGGRAVIVVVNLGTRPLRDVAISSGADALPMGRWTTRDLLGGARGEGMRIARDGRLSGWLPGTLAPRQGYIWELTGGR